MENRRGSESAAQAEGETNPVGVQDGMLGMRDEATEGGLVHDGNTKDGSHSGLDQSLSSLDGDQGGHISQGAEAGTDEVLPTTYHARPRSASVGSPTKLDGRAVRHASTAGREMQDIMDSVYNRTGRLRESLSAGNAGSTLVRADCDRHSEREETRSVQLPQNAVATGTPRMQDVVAGTRQCESTSTLERMHAQQRHAQELLRQTREWQGRAVDLQRRLQARGERVGIGIEQSRNPTSSMQTRSGASQLVQGTGLSIPENGGYVEDPLVQGRIGQTEQDRQHAMYLASVHTSAEAVRSPYGAAASGPYQLPVGRLQYVAGMGPQTLGPVAGMGPQTLGPVAGMGLQTSGHVAGMGPHTLGTVAGAGPQTLGPIGGTDPQILGPDAMYEVRSREQRSEIGGQGCLPWDRTQRERSMNMPVNENRSQREEWSTDGGPGRRRLRTGCAQAGPPQGSSGSRSTAAMDPDLVARSLAQMGGCFRSIWKQMEVADVERFTGEAGTRDYQEWKLEVQRKCDQHYQDPSMQLAIIQGACSGAACEFVNSHLQQHPNETVRGLLRAIRVRFCIVDDEYHALAELERTVQFQDEIPANFVERLLRLSRIAYADDPSFRSSRQYEKVMIRHFVRGLRSAEVKKYLISREPEDLDDAVLLANRKVKEIARRSEYGLEDDSRRSMHDGRNRDERSRSPDRLSRRDRHRRSQGSTTSASSLLPATLRASKRSVAGVEAVRHYSSSDSDGDVARPYGSSDDERPGVCEVHRRTRTASERRESTSHRQAVASEKQTEPSATQEARERLSGTPRKGGCQCPCRCSVTQESTNRRENSPVRRQGANRYQSRGTRHPTSPTRSKQESPAHGRSSGVCFRCGQNGHWARSCTNQPNSDQQSEPGLARVKPGGAAESKNG